MRNLLNVDLPLFLVEHIKNLFFLTFHIIYGNFISFSRHFINNMFHKKEKHK